MGLSGLSLGGYAYAVEPRHSGIASYSVRPANWPSGLQLKIAAIADLHASVPVMPEERMQAIVATTNALGADIIVLLGDFVVRPGHTFFEPLSHDVWGEALSILKAPLGVHAILGNHDWWEDRDVQASRRGVTRVQRTLERVGIRVHHNDAVRLSKGPHAFWIAGLADQWAYYHPGDRRARPMTFGHEGLDDLPRTLSKVTDSAPVILLAHEPDVFPRVPRRVALTLAGHTHGGQVAVLGYAPVTGSCYGSRYLHGHIVEDGRHLIVSRGLGCSFLPIRFGAPPEIVVVEVG